MEYIDRIIYSEESLMPDLIRQPYDYLAALPGNNGDVRGQFIRGFNDLYYRVDDAGAIDTISNIITIFHNASLLIDDIEDDSPFRRGFPAAHTKFGMALTLNCGNMMYFFALHKAQHVLPRYLPHQDKDTASTSILNILVEELLHLHRGQGLDIHWRDHLGSITLPRIDEYMEMIMNKTGGLFRLAVKLLGVFSEQKDQKLILAIANLFGIVFQIRDDYLSLVDERYHKMKGIKGEDLVEGKLSLPILHSLQNLDEDSPVHTLMYTMDPHQRRKNPELIDKAITHMQETKSLAFTKETLQLYGEKIKDLVGHNTDSFLIDMVDKLLNSI